MEKLWSKYRILVFGAMALVVLFFIIHLFFSMDREVDVMAFEPEPLPEEMPEEEIAVEENTTIFVEVKGAVDYPGVFEVPKDARVKNVLEMARLRSDADLMTVNQSMKLQDEMVVYVPVLGEEVAEGVPFGNEEEEEDAPVNINTAGVPELTTLNGIGEKKAQLLIDYREENGLFMKLEDIKNIPGIGDKTFESLKPYITIDE